MKIKTQELSGTALDWAVCLAQGLQPVLADDKGRTLAQVGTTVQAPSRNWAQGGPIIERERIRLDPRESEWKAQDWDNGLRDFFGPTPLVAAMRCFVASKLGVEVDVPEEPAPKRPCRSPYCECSPGQCTHPGCYDARGTP